MSDKYSNGMYKTTSKKQDKLSQDIFKSFKTNIYMLTNFNQESGNCWFSYCDNSTDATILQIFVDRKGNIITL